MSNKRDIEPSLDFFELRRRHEEYKNSQQKARPAAAKPAAKAAGAVKEAVQDAGDAVVDSVENTVNAVSDAAQDAAGTVTEAVAEPMDVEVLTPRQPSKTDIEAVISLLSRGDEEFAESLRARLTDDGA